MWSDGLTGLTAGTFSNNGGATPGTVTYTASTSAPSSVTLTLLTSGGSCGTQSATKSLTINPTPTVSIGSALTAICQGGTTGDLGGSFGGGATSAIWSDGLTGATAGTFINNTGSTPGTATYKASATAPASVTLTLTTSGGSCGTTSASKSLVITPTVGTPSVITINGGSEPTCKLTNATTTTSYTTSASNATSFTWSLSTATAGSISSTGLMTWANGFSGTVIIQVVANGCNGPSAMVTKSVTINPPFIPIITAVPNPICLGQSSTLTASSLSTLGSIAGGDFSNANPPGWSGSNANNSNGATNSDWGLANGGKIFSGNIVYDATNTPSSGKFFIVNGTTTGPGVINVLTTPLFSTVGMITGSLDWWQAYNLNAGTIARVEISIDGGSTYTTLSNYTGTTPSTTSFVSTSLSLNAYLGQPNVKIRFYYSGTIGSNWAIDDVKITATFQPVSYTFSGPGLSGTGQSVVVTPTALGNNDYIITTTTGSCLSTTTSVTVVVNPLPTISGTLTVCAASTTQLTGSATAATTNAWVSASPGIATVSNTGLVTGVSAGASVITYTNSNGCTITATVSVNPLPNITGTLVICSGTTSQLTGSGSAALTNPWISATPSVASVNSSGLVLGVSAGSSVITYRNINGCTVTATVSIDAATVPGTLASISACASGTAATLTLTGNNGVISQWQSSLDNFATAGTPTSQSIVVTAQTTYYRALVKNGACPTVPSSVAIVGLRNVWTGATSTNWNIATNWSDNQLPSTSCPDVTIQNVTNKPILSSGLSTITNLIIQPLAGLTISNTGLLQIGGTITKSGTATFNVSDGALEFNGSALQSIDGKIFVGNALKNLRVSNPVGISISGAVGDSLRILDSLSFGVANSTVTTNDNLVMASTATGTSRVADITNNGTTPGNKFVGKVTVERFYFASRSWRLVTSPLSNTGNIFSSWQDGAPSTYVPGKGMFVSGLNPTGAGGNGLDFSVFNNFSMRGWNYLTSTYVDVADTRTQNLSNNSGAAGIASNIGYYAFVRGDRNRTPDNTTFPNSNNTTLSSKGNLQTGPQTFNFPLATTTAMYPLIGNPYASSVDFTKITKTNIYPLRFYVYDPSLGSVGLFVIMEAPTATGTFASALQPTTKQKNFIQSSQAFFVQSIANGPASVTFDEDDKSNNYTAGLFRPVSPTNNKQALRVTLLQANSDQSTLMVDATMAEFDEQYKDNIDIQDALKFTNITENLSLLRYKQYLAIERRPLIKDEDTLFLQLTKTTQRSYRFAIEPTNLDATLTAFLEDSYTGKSTPISVSANSDFDFAITADAKSSAANRFRIVFKQTTPVSSATFKTIKANEQNGKIAVSWTIENERNIKHYEVEKSADGITFTKVNTTTATGGNSNSIEYNWLDVNPLSGNNFYRVRSIGSDGKFSYSSTVMVNMGTLVSGIRIYPNPVSELIGAEFKNMSGGIYKARLLNALGQTVLIKTINHATGTSMENIKPDYKLLSGVYQLEITAPDKEITTVKVIVK